MATLAENPGEKLCFTKPSDSSFKKYLQGHLGQRYNMRNNL